MRVFDQSIKNTLALLSKYEAKPLSVSQDYPSEKEKAFVFNDEAKISLGDRSHPSSYLIAYTSDESLVKEDESFLIGEDIPSLKGGVPFARIAFIRLEALDKKEQELYHLLRNIEYTRYHLNPKGYMLRVNTNELREGALINEDALKEGFTFSSLSSLFSKAYKKQSAVKAAKQFFITDPSFDYAKLHELAKENEGIVVALDHIMKKLKMDCNSCEFKGVCDEIDELRAIHQKEMK